MPSVTLSPRTPLALDRPVLLTDPGVDPFDPRRAAPRLDLAASPSVLSADEEEEDDFMFGDDEEEEDDDVDDEDEEDEDDEDEDEEEWEDDDEEEEDEEDEEDDFTVPIMFLVFLYFTINY